MITFTSPLIHWNYYLAIENDLDHVARYVEFSKENLNTYSIELAHLLLSASSEVDVILKRLCKLLSPNTSPKNINSYKNIIKTSCSDLIKEEIIIDRYGMSYKPWINWSSAQNPDWWKSYNKVKHQRDEFFKQANLKNTINSVGALLITVIYFYKYQFSSENNNIIDFKETTRHLQPDSKLIKINNDYYYNNLIV